MELEASGENCLGDFTFDFYWQHKGSRLDPDKTVGGVSRRQIVGALIEGEDVHIKGDAGSRLGSSLGVDLVKFGGNGKALNGTGSIIVDGDAGSRMGISMIRGSIYLSGNASTPLGNVVEVETDKTGYRKFISITEVLEKGAVLIGPNRLTEKGLIVSDLIVRDTIGARSRADKSIYIKGDAGMSTGILMRYGSIDISGDTGSNTGVLLCGGQILVHGSTEDFTGAEMRDGKIFIQGSAGSYACAKMKGGAVYARSGKAVPPAKEKPIDQAEMAILIKNLGLNPIHAMMYKKLGL